MEGEKDMKKRIVFAAFILCMMMGFAGCAPAMEDFPDGYFRINAGGRHYFSGAYRGQIFIDARRDDIVQLVLNGATLYNPNGAAIYAPRSQRVEIILAEGTVNTVANRRDNDVININHDLIISGEGTLNVNGHSRHGIRSQDLITIESGIINATAVGSAIRGRDGVIIEGGNLALASTGDTIRTTLDTDAGSSIIINGGEVNITSGSDGMQAVSDVIINDGVINISARNDGISSGDSIIVNGGAVNIVSEEGIETRRVYITGGDININATNDGINVRYIIEDEDGELFANRRRNTDDIYIRMTGGNVRIHSMRDSIESDGLVFLEGGTMHISGITSRRVSGEFVLDGGELASVGNLIRVAEDSTQPYIESSVSRLLADAQIEVMDENSNVRLTYVTRGATSGYAVFSSPEFANRATYFIYVNGAQRTYGEARR
jgi:hypothetical protein